MLKFRNVGGKKMRGSESVEREKDCRCVLSCEYLTNNQLTLNINNYNLSMSMMYEHMCLCVSGCQMMASRQTDATILCDIVYILRKLFTRKKNIPRLMQSEQDILFIQIAHLTYRKMPFKIHT